MYPRKTSQRTCWSILANCLSQCSPIKLLLFVSAGIATVIYQQSGSNLISSSPVALPKPEVEFKPLLMIAPPPSAHHHHKVIKPFFKSANVPQSKQTPAKQKKSKCDLFINDRLTGLTKYGNSRTSVGCLFKDDNCFVTVNDRVRMFPTAYYVGMIDDDNSWSNPLVACKVKSN